MYAPRVPQQQSDFVALGERANILRGRMVTGCLCKIILVTLVLSPQESCGPKYFHFGVIQPVARAIEVYYAAFENE